MGNTRGRRLGIFDDQEVKGLSNHDHRKLEEHVLEQLCELLEANQDSKVREVRDMVKQRLKPFIESLPKR
jgi:hypothetical protein